jgi:hypothetical protein
MGGKLFNWDIIREVYVTGEMTLLDLSKERTGNPKSPSKASIYNRAAASKENWELLRATYRSSLMPEYPVTVKTTSLPPNTSEDGSIVMGLPAAIYEAHYAQYLPDRLRERAEKVIKNPELLSMQTDIAVCNALLGDIAEQLETGATGGLWKRLRQSLKEMRSAQGKAATATKKGDADEEVRQQTIASNALAKIFNLIEEGADAAEAREELAKYQAHKKNLIESEIKRLLHMQAFVRIEDSVNFASALIDIVKRYVSDPDTLDAIGTAFESEACKLSNPDAEAA